MSAACPQQKAFLLMARRSSDGERIIARHPDAATLTGARFDPQSSLSDALKSELNHDLARHAPSLVHCGKAMRFDARYWWLRRQLAARMRASTSIVELPRLWRGLIQRSAAQQDQALRMIGLDIVASALIVESRSTAVTWLAPLGTRVARAVVDRALALRAQQAPRDLATRWHDAFNDVRRFGRHRPLDRLGLGLLADLYAALPNEARKLLEPLMTRLTDPSASMGLVRDESDRDVGMMLANRVLDEFAK
jgi:hypothetical protein